MVSDVLDGQNVNGWEVDEEVLAVEDGLEVGKDGVDLGLDDSEAVLWVDAAES